MSLAPFTPFLLLGFALTLATSAPAQTPTPAPMRPLVDLYTGYFPFHGEDAASPAAWSARRAAIRDRVLLAAGLFPLPTKTPLHAVVHGRVERDDYTIDRVFFESFPGHYVTGNLYRPKSLPAGATMPGILSPHGHWPDGRFMDLGADSPAVKAQLATGAERFESGARSFLQARCVQLARMGCAVFIYDMLGYADSLQVAAHRDRRRDELCGDEPGTFGLLSPMADLRLESNFGWQTWNSIRALDFLLTVPGVDPTRLSCTGESGGGTQTLMLAAIDDRLATAFPAVMVSTAMQGGCLCENASYLRLGQGNVDLAAAFAPKPLGLTAANDWTKELATKGFPDLQRVWTQLGHPENLTATFNTHWPHNYNQVSRATMYGFMSEHFHLGFSLPVLERDFVVSSPAELTVWTADHPKPSGQHVGGAHEEAVLKYWSEDADRQLAGRDDLVRRAWEIMLDNPAPAATAVRFLPVSSSQPVPLGETRGEIKSAQTGTTIPCAILAPTNTTPNGTIVLWLTDTNPAADAASATSAIDQLRSVGSVVVRPTLYLQGATRQPLLPPADGDPDRRDWTSAACYTFGYNPTLLAQRVRDVATVVAWLKAQPEFAHAKLIVAGSAGAGATAATAVALLPDQIDRAVLALDGFRFARVRDMADPMFVPGAVKYGDVPALLRLGAAARPVVFDDAAQPADDAALARAVLTAIAAPRH